MTQRLPIARIAIHQPRIPLRRPFRHAAAERGVSEPLLLSMELSNGVVGWGETHPREYVTGETAATAIAAIEKTFFPLLLETRPANFGEAIEAAAALPLVDQNEKTVTAARAAVELAMLDAYSRAFARSIESVAGWVAETWLGAPGSTASCRYSMVLSASAPAKAAKTAARLRLLGIRHFKLKVGDAGDDARLAAVARVLRRGLANGKYSLRLDANAAWNLPTAVEKLQRWEQLPITCVEQPMPPGNVHEWAALATQTNLPLMADESLVTPEDAEALAAYGAASWFNIRISKNGGLIPALRLAGVAHENNLDVQLGCMVGETSILSAAGRWFLQLVPEVRFAEGSFGAFLLARDVVPRPLRFGLGGRWKPLTGPGLGVAPNADLVAALCPEPALMFPF